MVPLPTPLIFSRPATGSTPQRVDFSLHLSGTDNLANLINAQSTAIQEPIPRHQGETAFFQKFKNPVAAVFRVLLRIAGADLHQPLLVIDFVGANRGGDNNRDPQTAVEREFRGFGP